MGAKIHYSRRAEADLLRLESFIASENPRAAAAAIEQLLQRIEMLADFPLAGVHPAKSVRKLVLPYGKSGYVVRYRVTSDAVVITRIWHGKEDRSG